MAVLEGQNILVTISGKKGRIRVYYLSWLKQKILRTEGVSSKSVDAFLFSDSRVFAGREKKRMGQRWRFARSDSFQNREIRKDQIPRRWSGKLDRDLRLGTKTVSQVYGFQGMKLLFLLS